MITISVVLTAALLLPAERPVVLQGFDCAKAQTRVEKMVCSERSFATLTSILAVISRRRASQSPLRRACRAIRRSG